MANIFSPKIFRARLHDLQRAPEPRRKRWLVVTSGVSMVLVIFLWVMYLNLTVPSPEAAQKPPAAAPAENSPDKTGGVGDTLSRGFSSITDDIKQKWDEAKAATGEALQALKSALEKKNQFSLEASTSTAATSTPELSTVPAVPLPEAPLKTR